jgi:hypothetical protein
LAAVILFALSICLVWVGFRWGMALEGALPFPSPWSMAWSWALVIGLILWKASRRPRDEVRSWLRLRILWRRRRWVALFGFPVAVMVLSTGLGLACSAGHWFDAPPREGAQYILTYAALFGVSGFCGAFALHLPGTDGFGPSQR